MKSIISSSKTVENDYYEQLLVDEKGRSSKLENEVSLLQREMGKKEVKMKGLQRDLLRFQVSVETASKEVRALSAQLSSAQSTIQEKDQEIKRLLEVQQDKDKELGVSKVRIDFLEETIKKWETIRTIDGLADVSTSTNTNTNTKSIELNSIINTDAVVDDDEVSALRKQITVMKTLQNRDENDTNTNRMPHDIYSTHLMKLLKLAEDAINKT